MQSPWLALACSSPGENMLNYSYTRSTSTMARTLCPGFQMQHVPPHRLPLLVNACFAQAEKSYYCSSSLFFCSVPTPSICRSQRLYL